MKLASALFGCFGRRRSTKPDAFDARLQSLAAPVRATARRSRVALPTLFRHAVQATA